MRKVICGIIIGFLITTNAYALRIEKPRRLTDFDVNNLVVLNDTLENLWNITNGRYEEFDRRLILTPSATTDITAAGGIKVITTLIRIQGSGGAVDITANPQIADGTDGQIIIIQGDSDTNTVKLDDGTGLALDLGASFTMTKGDIMQFIFDSGDDVWYEMTRNNH